MLPFTRTYRGEGGSVAVKFSHVLLKHITGGEESLTLFTSEDLGESDVLLYVPLQLILRREKLSAMLAFMFLGHDGHENRLNRL